MSTIRRMLPARLLAAGIATTLLLTAPALLAAPGDPLGPAFTVDAGDIGESFGDPVIARDAAGNFVAAWTWQGRDSDNRFYSEVRVRRHYADGTPQGPAQTISPADHRPQAPAVSMNAAGDYVVTWRSPDPARGARIHARSFDTSGAARSPLLDVARLGQGIGYHSVTMNAAGSFVVTWNNFTLLGLIPTSNEGLLYIGGSTVHARRFGLDGSSNGSILVSTSVTNPTPLFGTNGTAPPVAAVDAQGNFVVAWEDNTALLRPVIHARRFRHDGLGIGLKVRVNPLTQANASWPSIGMDAAGNYAIGWATPHQTSPNSYSGHDLHFRRYSSAGIAQGDPVQVGDRLSLEPRSSLAMAPEGHFAIAWVGTPSAACCIPKQILLQHYSAAGTPQGGVVVVADDIATNESPTAGIDGYGNVAVIWKELQQLKARLYQGF